MKLNYRNGTVNTGQKPKEGHSVNPNS